MLGRLRMMGFILVAPMLAQASICAQTAAPRAPVAFAGCYNLALGAWSRPLGVNAAFHAIPTTIRLDTAAATRGGWRVSPDIVYPYPRRFPGTPRWTAANDTLEIMWSNGYQPTTLRLGRHGTDELRGHAVVWSDANEYGTDLPRAEVAARRIACAPLE
jgi:hypothetical protein